MKMLRAIVARMARNGLKQILVMVHVENVQLQYRCGGLMGRRRLIDGSGLSPSPLVSPRSSSHDSGASSAGVSSSSARVLGCPHHPSAKRPPQRHR